MAEAQGKDKCGTARVRISRDASISSEIHLIADDCFSTWDILQYGRNCHFHLGDCGIHSPRLRESMLKALDVQYIVDCMPGRDAEIAR